MKNNLASIHELRIEGNWRIDNGKDSFVVPFPSTYPFTLVFHGQSKFEYGHYGIHLGQEDRLTFLGDPNQEIKAYFIDCRKDSPTKGKRLIYILNPSSEYCLCIPPGVAHAFDGLENIYTLNTYKLYLPSPDKWLSGETNWNIENDVINLPMDVSDDQLNFFEPNNCEASEVFYELIRAHQKENLPKIDSEYPFTEDLEFNDGSSARLMFRKTELKKNHFPDWEPIEGIQGLAWEKHLIYWSGDESGFIPFLDSSTFYVVDHGIESYTHDAFGIHLSQQDRLTFVGAPDQTVILHLVDCRQDSPTKHREIKIEFKPSPLRFLVIPTGVAHRFENLHKVFTINRPFIYSDDIEEYEPGNDVIDWDIDNKSYPSYQVSSEPATEAFYKLQAQSQQSLMSQPATHSTPIVIATVNDEGNDIKVAIRKNE